MQSSQQVVAVIDRGQEAGRRHPLTLDGDWPSTLKGCAAGVGRFFLHFAEMWIVMLIGMAAFVPVKLTLVSLGYAALLDTSSIDFQAWMGVFMAAPMVAWMHLEVVRNTGRRWVLRPVGGGPSKKRGLREGLWTLSTEQINATCRLVRDVG
jgi:hypothetical protein